MNVTVVGCGHAGSTIAADLSLKGHNVTLLKTSNKLHNEHFEKIYKEQKINITENNISKDANLVVTTNFEEAITSANLIILYIQTNYHENVIKKICKYISDGQIILIEPGYLSTSYFLKHTNKDITIVEAESSPIDCRIISPGKVQVLFKNVVNPVGVYPRKNIPLAKEKLSKLDYNFEYISTVVEAALHNPNLIVHTIGAIFSIPRIEYTNKYGGNYSMYREVFTPHIWNLVLSLDEEKMNVLEKLGCDRLSYVDACKKRNSNDDNRDATEVFFDYAHNSSPSGPDIPDSRYITEDVPEGLVLLESLGKVLNIKTPTCSGLINCANALLKCDFRQEGRTIEKLGIETINIILSECEKND